MHFSLMDVMCKNTLNVKLATSITGMARRIFMPLYKVDEQCYPQNMKNYPEMIETSLRNKDYSLMNEHITKYLKSEKYSKSARLIASEFYRRISEYSKGLELLHWQNESFNWKNIPDQEIRIRLQSVRLLNLLGASSFAVRVLDTMDEATQQRYYEIIAPIYLSNEKPGATVRLYSFLLALPAKEWNYQTRLRLIGLADAYSALGKHGEALALGERLLAMSSEPAILAILNEAMGGYCVYSGDIKKAAIFQEKAKTFFTNDETTVDHGYLLKWIGARLVMEGKLDEARVPLEKAFSILYKKGLKPEVWLDVLYWRGLLEHQENGKKFPAVWKMLLCYPGVNHRFQKEISRWVQIPPKIAFNEAPDSKVFLHYYEEVRANRQTHTLGLTLPEKILSLLLASGEWGVPFYRVCDAIWQDDLFTFGQHLKRLDQGLVRLRREGIRAEWKEMHLKLLPSKKLAQFQLVMNSQPTQPGGLFFEKVKQQNDSRFTRSDVESYFGFCRSRAAGLCQQWVEERVTTLEKNGQIISYRVIEKSE